MYHPSYGEWATLDPLLLSKPEFFAKVNHIKEVNGVEYAQGNPVSLSDPTGNIVTVYSRPLDFGGVLGMLGSHTFIEVIKNNGDKVQISGTGMIGTKITIRVGNNVDKTQGFKNVASKEIKAPKGMSQNDWDNAVITAGKKLQQKWSGKLDYSATGGDRKKDANCHDATREVLDSAGGQGKQLNDFNPPGVNPGLNK